MKKILPAIIFIFYLPAAYCQPGPEITSWKINSTGLTGYDGIPSDVQQVQYSTDNVYVSCTCIPSYDIGPWPTDPNVPTNQNFVFKIARNPAENTGTLISTPLGHIGTWSNGVSIFNAKDANSYNDLGIWNQNAVIVEGESFDACLGHPAPGGEYHTHLNPTCLYDDQDSAQHSPIIGYAFDGFPVYGAFGFKNTDGTGGITTMRSSYRLRSISDRTTLADGTLLPPSEYGPTISGTYPLGYYIEDYEYVPGLGDLDEHNGRFCITPDYPDGIYAYFVTLNADGTARYPYTLGPTYYGTVQPGNTGPGSGHNTISEDVQTYSSIGDPQDEQINMLIFPNPFTDYLNIYIDPSYHNNLTATLLDATGRILTTQNYLQPGVSYSFNMTHLPDGIYFIRVENKDAAGMEAVVKSAD